jgi:hypothetical protein
MPSQIKVDEIKNVAGQYEIKTNTFKGQTTAGSIAVQGEGTATTNLQQGLAKAFSLTAADGASITDSFNVSSLTDTASGQQTIVFNTDFGSANHVVNANNGSGVDHFVTIATKAAGTQLLKSYDAGATAFVDSIINMTAHGDLA